MLLTIVIPVYNVSNYLRDCLSSLPDDCKVVLVNDGSTDGSEVICRQFADERANALAVDKPNGGLADARNFGMQFVDTEYVFFLDSDDKIDGKNLMEALNFTVTNNLDWVQCGYAYDYGTKLVIYKHHDLVPIICGKDEISRQLANDAFIKNFAWGKIYRTSIVKTFEFPKGKYFEDSFWQYLIVDKSRSFGIYPSLVTFYRQRQESISGNFSIRNLDLIEGLKQRLDFYILHPDEYGDFIGDAAVNLWHVAESFADSAATNTPELKYIFETKLEELKNLYPDEIKSGISKKSLFAKLELSSRFYGKSMLYRYTNILRRILNRFLPSAYRTIIVSQ